MEYICLILQILFLLGTVFLPTGDTYLVFFNKIYKNFLIFEIIMQTFCFIANIIFVFISKGIVIYILCLDIYLMGLIKTYFTIHAKSKYYQELIKVIKEERLENFTSSKIRKYLLEKFEHVYSIQDIEKCLKKINNV